MSNTGPHGDEARPLGDVPEPPSLVQLLRALLEDASTLIEAEATYWRTAFGYAVRRTKSIAVLAVLALFFAFFTLMAVVVGLLLALAPLIGAWSALGLVAGTLALACIVCVRLAIRRVRRMIRLLTLSDGGDAS